jgi:hypothetical protein
MPQWGGDAVPAEGEKVAPEGESPLEPVEPGEAEGAAEGDELMKPDPSYDGG